MADNQDMSDFCDTFWGSHGCDKPSGHAETGDPVHVCGSQDPEGQCSHHDGVETVRFVDQDTFELLPPMDGMPAFSLEEKRA